MDAPNASLGRLAARGLNDGGDLDSAGPLDDGKLGFRTGGGDKDNAGAC